MIDLISSVTIHLILREGYDEVLEADNWVIARQDDTYVALYSHQAVSWADDTRYLQNKEFQTPPKVFSMSNLNPDPTKRHFQ